MPCPRQKRTSSCQTTPAPATTSEAVSVRLDADVAKTRHDHAARNARAQHHVAAAAEDGNCEPSGRRIGQSVARTSLSGIGTREELRARRQAQRIEAPAAPRRCAALRCVVSTSRNVRLILGSTHTARARHASVASRAATCPTSAAANRIPASIEARPISARAHACRSDATLRSSAMQCTETVRVPARCRRAIRARRCRRGTGWPARS